VYSFTGSWLNNSISDRMLDPNDEFVVFRKDRTDFSGGGICAVVKNR